MQTETDKNLFSSPDQLLRSLARELKNPLTLIARQAELENIGNQNKAFFSIKTTAEQTLKLLDSYLLMAQSEYGQTTLPLHSIGVGSAIYDVMQELRPETRRRNINLITDIKDANVYANPSALKSSLWCITDLVLKLRDSETGKKESMLQLNTAKHHDKVTVSVLAKNFVVSKSDLNQAHSLQGKAHLALTSASDDSGIRLAIADILVKALGSSLRPIKRGSLKGLSFDLIRSQQLQWAF